MIHNESVEIVAGGKRTGVSLQQQAGLVWARMTAIATMSQDPFGKVASRFAIILSREREG